MPRRSRATSSLLVLALVAPAVEAIAPPVQLFAWQRALAGVSAYCAATLVSSPVDVVKCRLQLKSEDSAKKEGLYPLVMCMLQQEGPLVFFSGITPALLMAPAAVVQYTLIDPLRDMMPLFAAAVVAGSLDILIKCPFERLKTMMQSGEKVSPATILQRTYATHGVRGLWAGLGATLARDVPYLVLKWLTYVQCQTLFSSLELGGQTANLLAGAVAGAVAATFVTPADVIKTRCQVSSANGASPLNVGRELLAEGGIPALFRGIGPRLMRIPLYTSITLAIFDMVKAFFAAQTGVGKLEL